VVAQNRIYQTTMSAAKKWKITIALNTRSCHFWFARIQY